MKKLIFLKFAKDTLSFFLILCLAIGLIVWTLQAVNYFDYVTQDGHGLKTYFSYILLNFPKIIHRIIPFIFFISLFYMLIIGRIINQSEGLAFSAMSLFSFLQKSESPNFGSRTNWGKHQRRTLRTHLVKNVSFW